MRPSSQCRPSVSLRTFCLQARQAASFQQRVFIPTASRQCRIVGVSTGRHRYRKRKPFRAFLPFSLIWCSFLPGCKNEPKRSRRTKKMPDVCSGCAEILRNSLATLPRTTKNFRALHLRSRPGGIFFEGRGARFRILSVSPESYRGTGRPFLKGRGDGPGGRVLIPGGNSFD